MITNSFKMNLHQDSEAPVAMINNPSKGAEVKKKIKKEDWPSLG